MVFSRAIAPRTGCESRSWRRISHGAYGTTCVTGTCTNTTYYADITTSDGVVYHRSFSVVDVTNQVTLKLVTATVSYADDQDSTITHSQTMQMIRTTLEGL